MIDFLLNPWVITIIVFSFLIGNIAAFKYADKITARQLKDREKKSDIEKLIELDKKHRENEKSGKE